VRWSLWRQSCTKSRRSYRASIVLPKTWCVHAAARYTKYYSEVLCISVLVRWERPAGQSATDRLRQIRADAKSYAPTDWTERRATLFLSDAAGSVSFGTSPRRVSLVLGFPGRDPALSSHPSVRPVLCLCLLPVVSYRVRVVLRAAATRPMPAAGSYARASARTKRRRPTTDASSGRAGAEEAHWRRAGPVRAATRPTEMPRGGARGRYCAEGAESIGRDGDTRAAGLVRNNQRPLSLLLVPLPPSALGPRASAVRRASVGRASEAWRPGPGELALYGVFRRSLFRSAHVGGRAAAGPGRAGPGRLDRTENPRILPGGRTQLVPHTRCHEVRPSVRPSGLRGELSW